MKSALTSVTFNGKPIEEIVSLAQKAGLSAIEWGAKTHVVAGDLEAAKKAKALTEGAGLTVSGYGSYYYAMPGEDFTPTLETALALGAPVIRVWSGRGYKDSENCPEDLRKQITENLQNAAAEAKKYGITVATEYHAFSLTDTIESVKRLLAEAPDLSTYWQPRTHPVLGAEADVANIKALGEKIVNAHALCWIDGVPQTLATWEDNWAQYVTALRTHTKANFAAIEFVKDNTEEQFFADAETLKKVLSKI